MGVCLQLNSWVVSLVHFLAHAVPSKKFFFCHERQADTKFNFSQQSSIASADRTVKQFSKYVVCPFFSKKFNKCLPTWKKHNRSRKNPHKNQFNYRSPENIKTTGATMEWSRQRTVSLKVLSSRWLKSSESCSVG